jgi:hypothetical protein
LVRPTKYVARHPIRIAARKIFSILKKHKTERQCDNRQATTKEVLPRKIAGRGWLTSRAGDNARPATLHSLGARCASLLSTTKREIEGDLCGACHR